jgi:site-specific DNA-adenine methylase
MLKSNKNFVEVQENHLVNFENLHQEGVLSFIENNMDDEEDKKILEKRLSGMTFSEISSDMNDKFSGEWIRQKYKRILDRYKKILDNE